MYRLMDTKGAMRADGAPYAEAATRAQSIANGADFTEAEVDALNLVPDELRGLDRFEARQKVVDQITAEGLAVMTQAGDPRLGACVARTPNFFCIGLNYAKHAAETGATPPKEPILFSKASSALNAPNDDVILPKDCTMGDWEAELGVVIGAHVEHVSETDALSTVAGYCVINDVSERHFQAHRGGQWIKGKSCPTFGPTGPWLVTADEIEDHTKMRLQTRLNGETVQDTTLDMLVCSIPRLISYCSTILPLLPGDVIVSGTPGGVGARRNPPLFMKDGDVCEVEVSGVGILRNPVQAEQ